jgi:5-methyltetrahydrofolate--homocysteine methyltransferase
VRQAYLGQAQAASIFSLKDAREKKLKIDWKKEDVIKPKFLGTKIFKDFDLQKIRERLDWTFFFIAWDMRAKYPDILNHPQYGKEAKRLLKEANYFLDEIISQKLISAQGVLGIYPANSVGDDIEIYQDEKRSKLLTTVHTLRQQTPSEDGLCYSLADFIAPQEKGFVDYMGAFAVTAGVEVEKLVEKYKKENNDYKAMMFQILADRLAEGFAETLHERLRKEFWGYAPQEHSNNEDLFQGKYQGIRPAVGYPVCPDHSEKQILFDLMNVKNSIGIELTEHYAMKPLASVCGLYFAQPKAKYFSVGKILKDQVEDYAKRKKIKISEAQKWLAQNISY